MNRGGYIQHNKDLAGVILLMTHVLVFVIGVASAFIVVFWLGGDLCRSAIQSAINFL